MNKEVKVTFSGEDKNFAASFQKASKDVQDAFGKIVNAAKFTGNQKNYFDTLRESLAAYEKDLQRQIAEEKKYLSERRESARKRGGGYFTEKQQQEFSQGSGAIRELEATQSQMRDFVEQFISTEKERVINEKRESQEKRLEEKQALLEDKIENKKEREDRKKSEESRSVRDSRIVNVVDIMKGVVGSNNAYQAIATSVPGVTSLLTGNPIINAISSLIGQGLQRGYEEGSKYTRSLADISQITGTPYKSSDVYGKGSFSKRLQEIRGRISGIEGKTEEVVTTDRGQALIRQDPSKLSKQEKDELNRLRSEERVITKGNYQEREERSIRGAYINANQIGLDATSFNQLRARYARASGSLNEYGALNVGYLMKGLGVGEDTAMQLEKQGRVTGYSSRSASEYMFGNLASRGRMNEGNTALLPEYLQTLIEVNQQQLERLGTIADADTNAGKIAAMTAITKSDNPELAKRLLGKFEQGFSESQNPYVRALQYQTLSEQGYSDIFQMRKIMEQPMQGKEGRTYIKGMIDKIKQISGGNSALGGSMLSSIFESSGQKMTLTESQKLMELSPADYEKFAKEYTGKSSDLNLPQRAMEAGTTDTEKRTAEWMSNIQVFGAKLLETTESMLSIFDKMADDSAKMAKSAGISAKEADNMAKTLKETANNMRRSK